MKTAREVAEQIDKWLEARTVYLAKSDRGGVEAILRQWGEQIREEVVERLEKRAKEKAREEGDMIRDELCAMIYTCIAEVRSIEIK